MGWLHVAQSGYGISLSESALESIELEDLVTECSAPTTAELEEEAKKNYKELGFLYRSF